MIKEKITKALAPKIHAQVSFDEILTEAIEAIGLHDYLGDPSNAPEPSDYITRGIIRHPNNPEGYAHLKSDGRVLNVPEDKIDEIADSLHRGYKKGLQATHNQLVDHFDTFTEADDKAVSKYTNSQAAINRGLLDGEPETPLVNALDKAIARHSAPDDIVVYSGMSREHSARLRGSKVVHHPAFLSSSLQIHAARTFANKGSGDIMKLVIPKGHPCAYVSSKSNHEGEREIILPRGMHIKVDKEKEQSYVSIYGKHKVHHCTIVKDGDSE